MFSPLNSLTKSFAVKLLVGCLTLFAPVGASLKYGPFLQTAVADPGHENIPTGWESYLDRPDILKVPAEGAKGLGAAWENLKAAHFSFVAELLELYPEDTHIYFLARDSEHLYDVARLATAGTPDFSRIHLLNVSRANMRDANIKNYLRENGISEESLSAGKKVLFVDTGFAGTIPRVIAENFSVEARSHLQTHLVVSANPMHPSSRTFLIHLNPSVNLLSPSQMHGTIVSYEHMARYTDRSSAYFRVGGHYHPISPKNTATDGSVSKSKSLEFMKDFKHEWEKPQTQARFNAERVQFRQIKEKLAQGTASAKSELKAELDKRKADPASEAIFEAQLRDILEARITAKLDIAMTHDDLGLSGMSVANSFAFVSKKNELIKKFPAWAPVLENPDNGIPKLFAEQNWQMIGNLLDANVDAEINRLLMMNLFDAPATGPKRDLQTGFIETAKPDSLAYLASHVFSKEQTKEMTDLLRLLIEHGDAYVLQTLAKHTFGRPHSLLMRDELKLLIEKADMKTLHSIASEVLPKRDAHKDKDLIELMIHRSQGDALASLVYSVFSKPENRDMTDQLKLVIEKADPAAMFYMAQFIFSQPHTEKMKDLLRLLILKADPPTLQKLAADTFDRPHTYQMHDEFKLLIERADSHTLATIASHTFSKRGIKGNRDLLKLAIEKANSESLPALTYSVFTNPDSKDYADLLELVIAKADPLTMQRLAEYVFTQPHTKDMRGLLGKLIAKADTQTMAQLASKTFLKPHTFWYHDELKLLIEKADRSDLISIANSVFLTRNNFQADKDLILLTIQRADAYILRLLITRVFRNPQSKDLQDLLKLVILKADSNSMQELAKFVFTEPHTREMKPLLRLLIERADQETLRELASHVFSKSQTKDIPELLKLVIEKADSRTMQTIADRVFTQAHAADMKDLLVLLIVKADAPTLSTLARTLSSETVQKFADLPKLSAAKNRTAMGFLKKLIPSLRPKEYFEIQILEKSLKIEDASARQEFIATELAKIDSPLVLAMKSSPAMATATSPVTSTPNSKTASAIQETKAQPISASLQPGDVVNIHGRTLRVIKKAGEGRRGVVFQVQAQSGAYYALKTVKNADPATLASLAQESAKTAQWRALNIPSSKVLVQEKEFVLKTWIEGVRGDEVIQKFAAGDPSYKQAADSLVKLVAKIRAQGAYVGDFRPANLIWVGKAWVIIDSGSIQQGMTLEEAQAKWSSADERGPKFQRRWNMQLPAQKMTCDLFLG